MGTVLKGHDRELGREVAIKLLPANVSEMLGADRFAQEIRLTARLVHPNIVPLFSSGEAAGCLYFVMPLIDGVTLRHRLQDSGPLPAAQVRRIMADLAEALAYAHASGVVHRDLKPENIFWYQERALLADFGIARPVGKPAPGDRLTQVGTHDRHARLREPGTGRGRSRPRRSLGSLQPWLRRVRAAHRAGALRGPEPGRHASPRTSPPRRPTCGSGAPTCRPAWRRSSSG